MNTTLLSLALFCLVAPPVKTEKTPQTLLYVRTTPSGAEIRLNGKPLGTSNNLFPVEPGDYKIVIDLEGHQPNEQKITIREGRITRIELELKKGPKVPLSTIGEDPATGQMGPAEEVLSRFQTALAESDFSKLEALFLPPDDTPAGKLRRKLLDEARRAWARSRGERGKVSLQHTITKQKVEGKDKLVSTTIMIDDVLTTGHTVRSEVAFEFRITPTDSGWKIAEMKNFAEKVWTCSMHPQVKMKEPKPGKCPVCALDLIPLTTTPSSRDLPDDEQITIREGEAWRTLLDVDRKDWALLRVLRDKGLLLATELKRKPDKPVMKKFLPKATPSERKPPLMPALHPPIAVGRLQMKNLAEKRYREGTDGTAVEALSFGPVVEELLEDPKKRVAELLDLDTGRRATFKQFGVDDRQTHKWIRQQKVDVMGLVKGDPLGLMLFDMAVYENRGIDWEEITPREVMDDRWLNQAEPNPIGILGATDRSKLPLSCLFETREGGKGVLQILGPGEPPKTVRIRYKMVESGAGIGSGRAETQPSEQKITVREGRITRIELELKKGPKTPRDDRTTREIGSAEEVFRRFQAAFTEFDFAKLEPLVLPFEDTPAGHHRRKLLDEARKVWPGYREELRKRKGKVRYSFTDIKQTVEGKDRLVSATIMHTNEHFEQAVGALEVRITPTDRGWKIAEVKMLPELWTCSLHPQVKSPEPGKCPVCAMDLVPSTPYARKVHLPDADTKGAEVVLDLISGQMLAIDPEAEGEIGQFTRLGKGDLMYDRLLGCLRGAKARLWKGNDIVTLPEEDRQGTATAYKLPEVPCRLLITTAEKTQFEVTILSVTDSGGINLEYRLVGVEEPVKPPAQ